MNTWLILSHLIWADFLERLRRYSFLVTLTSMIIAAYFLLPTPSAGYGIMLLGGHLDARGMWVDSYRGLYNSAWVGTQVALWAALWLSLLGFYLIKHTVELDRRTGVGQILATTPLRSVLYTSGKTISNVLVFVAMIMVLIVTSGILQFVRGEDQRLDVWALCSPFLIITLPTLVVVAALAVLFECIWWLRAGIGNVAYFFLWVAVVNASLSPANAPFDLLGFSPLLSQLRVVGKTRIPGFNGTVSVDGQYPVPRGAIHTFQWDGPSWTGDILLSRLLWLALAAVLALGAALFFSRFDPAREWRWHAARGISPSPVSTEQDAPVSIPAEHTLLQARLTPLPPRSQKPRLLRVLMGEWRLSLKGARWWWHAIAAGLAVACLIVPLAIARGYLFPFVWIWPLFIWSTLGNREARYQTQQVVYSAAHPLLRQLPMHWLAGVLVALLTASGMAVRFMAISDLPGLLALIVGALFIPSLALALGVWTENNRLFEVTYLALWYIGPINHLSTLDYMGVTSAVGVTQTPVAFYALATLVLLALAFAGRQRQLHQR